jgi:hypothetical protein
MYTDLQNEGKAQTMEIEASLGSIVHCDTNDIDELPLSEELRFDITKMTDLDDVSLINYLS